MKIQGIGLTKTTEAPTEDDLCHEEKCAHLTCGANALIYNNKALYIIETERVPEPGKWLTEQFNTVLPILNQSEVSQFETTVLGNNPAREYHHLCHAYGAYAQSGFSNASILVIDGRDSNVYHGEDSGVSIGIYKAEGNKLEVVRTYPIKYSLGAFYSWAVKCAGFGFNHKYAGKLMGASSYAIPAKNDYHFLLVDPQTGDPLEESNPFDVSSDKNGYIYLVNPLKKVFPCGKQTEFKFDFRQAQRAATFQSMYEESVFSLLQYIKNTLPSKNLIISGGCGLNCVCNGKIIRSGDWDNFFIPNMCEDQGNIIGRLVMELGQEVNKPYIYNKVTYPIPQGYRKQISKAELAKRIKEGQIVAWFEGGSEYGPRALCHRSLLGNPELRWMANRLNEVKTREYWRPLAPVVLDTHFKTFFDVDGRIWPLHKVMLATEYLRPEYQRKYQAICAPDNSSRPQVLLDTKDNHTLYSIMKDYDLPILVNTSMNGANEPICETPEDAINFASRNNDVLLVFAKNDKLYIKED